MFFNKREEKMFFNKRDEKMFFNKRDELTRRNDGREVASSAHDTTRLDPIFKLLVESIGSNVIDDADNQLLSHQKNQQDYDRDLSEKEELTCVSVSIPTRSE